METLVTSKRFSLNKYDWLKAALLAVGTPVIEYLIESGFKGGFHDINWTKVSSIGLAAGLMYIKKNLLTTTTTTVIQK